MLLAAAVLATGCAGITFGDDVSGMSLFNLHDDLTPLYVRGAEVTVHADGRRNQDFSDWNMVSDDASVFEVLTVERGEQTLRAHSVAQGEGTTTLSAINAAGNVRHKADIRVAFPDQIDLVANVDILGTTQRQPVPASDRLPIQVVAGNEALFEVRYFADGERAFGNGVLTFGATDSEVWLEADTNGAFHEDREWVRVIIDDDDTLHTVRLHADGDEADTFLFIGVLETDIASVNLDVGERPADDNGTGRIVAHAQTVDGGDVYGVDYDWFVNGESVGTFGDVAEFSEGDRGEQFVVEVVKNGLSDTMVVEGRFVGISSSTSIGCDATGGLSTAGWMFVAGLLGLRHREQQTSP